MFWFYFSCMNFLLQSGCWMAWFYYFWINILLQNSWWMAWFYFSGWTFCSYEAGEWSDSIYSGWTFCYKAKAVVCLRRDSFSYCGITMWSLRLETTSKSYYFNPMYMLLSVLCFYIPSYYSISPTLSLKCLDIFGQIGYWR